MAYPPPSRYTPTPEQSQNPAAAWNRDDETFFAAGACHLLAYAFHWLHPHQGYDIIYLEPQGDYPSDHVYIYRPADKLYRQAWGLDFAGWTPEAELLAVMHADYTRRYPGWSFKRRVITRLPLETFCRRHRHRLPADFLQPPWPRTHAYLERFSSTPPHR